jgi:hypothetical protein
MKNRLVFIICWESSVIRPPYRISVVGTSGSGKTAVASEIARRLKIPHVELDALHWRKGWQEAPAHEFRQQVDNATRADTWVADGNYHQVRDIVWRRATFVVWLASVRVLNDGVKTFFLISSNTNTPHHSCLV